jgi:hypothetical protein
MTSPPNAATPPGINLNIKGDGLMTDTAEPGRSI